MTAQTSPSDPENAGAAESRLHGAAYWALLTIGLAGLLLNVDRLFHLQFFIGYVLIDNAYFYLIAGLFLALAFLVYPAHLGASRAVPFYDWLLFAGTLATTAYLAWNGERIVSEGWDIISPTPAQFVAAFYCLMALEALRRIGGIILFSICLFFFAFPLFSEQMPGFLWGPSSDLSGVFLLHAFGLESIIGVPMRVVARLLIGFLVFGAALVATGGGEFFMDFATALMGRSRGGPAKVAILSSGFFGSLSGSVISNIVTTGQMTIPTMKRVGYAKTYAGAIEACASTGGALMPPVMGAVAFLMAENLNVPYATVMIAAVVPAFLFYLVLLLQTDCYAARKGLQGQPAAEIPALVETLKSGWHFLLSLVLLVYFLVWVGIESQAPYYATALLIATSALNGRITGRSCFHPRKLLVLLGEATRNITHIVGVLAGIGMIVGALSYTGVGGAFSRELLQFAGDNVYLLLILGAATSFVLGMGMTVSACYIFLAIVLGPALVRSGLDPLASHLFILYWGMLSYITPPVAMAAVAASAISGAKAMPTAIVAMRLGGLIFVLPFLFVLNPSLILNGEPLSILHNIATAVIAVWLLSCGAERWLHGVGEIGLGVSALLIAAAVCLVVPGLYSDLAGLTLTAVTFGWSYAQQHRTRKMQSPHCGRQQPS